MEIKEIKIYTYYNFLFWHYVVLEMSTCEIGRKYGINATTIGNWLRKHNIPIRTRSEAFKVYWSKKIKNIQYKNKKWLNNQYTILKLSTTEIAKKYGLKTWVIRYWLRKFNIPMRSCSEAMKIAMNRPEVKKKMSKAQKITHNKLEYRERMSKVMMGKNKGENSPHWKEWEEICYEHKHYRIKRMLEEEGIFEPNICPICNKKSNIRKMNLMNINHQYKENPLDYYYICGKCHIGKYHYLSGLKKCKKIKPIPNLIKNLLSLKTREERFKLLKEVILNVGIK